MLGWDGLELRPLVLPSEASDNAVSCAPPVGMLIQAPGSVFLNASQVTSLYTQV